ncbi:cytochrome c oxidase subunit 3 [Variovorax sp. RA8]|uniref:cytochrome c oxidase subunit 3 n=1 Tax=Variovorax sp. (strain JCM 16519 / RA8) TaxID=662548 RepID=UPI001317A9B7|nr:cytochrome c oxidase subunit 3 [Variovorax sp. RA8]VTU44782.1 Cytochrome o ubiquinol oxidase subunit 3 [Variovorax sp. RA8]
MNVSTTIPVPTGRSDDPGMIPSTSLPRPGAVVATGLWFFMGVATMLFGLLSLAYVFRLDGVEGYPLALPWQLWLSTGLLAIGSIALQRASGAARLTRRSRALGLLLFGGACTFLFLGVQLWAWSDMQAARVMLAGNPAGSFFYLLTAMHGLHVAGGIVAVVLTMRTVWSESDLAREAWRISLCARYWHFLWVVWAVLFAMMALLTPEAVRIICGTLKP